MFVFFSLNPLPDNYFKMNLFPNPPEKNAWYVLIGQCAIMHFMSFLFNLMLMYSFQRRRTMPRGDSVTPELLNTYLLCFICQRKEKKLCPLFFFFIIFFYKAFPDGLAWKHLALLHHNSQCTHSMSEWVITCSMSFIILYAPRGKGPCKSFLFFFKKYHFIKYLLHSRNFLFSPFNPHSFQWSYSRSYS